MNPELIEALKSFIRSKHLTEEWNTFRDNWFKSINSNEPNESEADSNNEWTQEKCTCNCSREVNIINDKHICTKCNKPL